MHEPKRTPLVPLKELATLAGCTKQAVYQATHGGFIPSVRCGRKLMIHPDALDYHLKNGWGRGVPPYAPDSETAR